MVMAKPLGAFTTADLQKLSGFSRSRLDKWATSGFVVPEITHPHVRGGRRLYSRKNAIMVTTIKLLIIDGWTTYRIRKSVDLLRNILDAPDDHFESAETAIILREKVKRAQIIVDTQAPALPVMTQLQLPWDED